jgi:Uma2 family endonuclease
MATKAMVTIEEYLRTSYEGTDREYIDGEVVERSMHTKKHSAVQARLVEIFYDLRRVGLPFRSYPELRHRATERRVRIPDVAIFAGPEPEEDVPTIPPLVAVEILSSDDRMTQVLEKLREYDTFGVPHIWLIDPEKKELYVYQHGSLSAVRECSIPEYSVTITHGTIFDI